MELTAEQFDRLYRGFRRSDTSLDGRVLVAVRTTGVYCLPSCRARKPRRENVRFYFSRDAAERDGFRACRRCRPDVLGGRRALEQAALRRWLVALAASDSGIGRLARANGSSPSGLYRMFRRHLGYGPRQARSEARLRSACELLCAGRHATFGGPIQQVRAVPGRAARRETHAASGTIAQVAYEAGFGSLATFYRWFRRVVGVTPSEFRCLAAQAKRETRVLHRKTLVERRARRTQ